MSAYAEFLVQKAITAPRCGLETVPALTPALYPFQADIVSWGTLVVPKGTPGGHLCRLRYNEP